MRRALSVAVIMSMLWVLGMEAARAQTILGSISGVVTDPRGDPIVGATVTIKNEDTGLTRVLTTNELGFYRADSLPIGENYTVTVEHPGFKKEIRTKIAVRAVAITRVDVQLQVGEIAEVIEVTATAAELLERTEARVAKSIESRQVFELPGRNTLTGLALLVPGTVPNVPGMPGSGFATSGGRSRSNNFNLDGSNNNDDSLSIPRQTVPPEAIAEFQIVTNNFNAEQGRNSGAVVNVITKSGTNEYHGTVHWTWAGNGLDALTLQQERVYRGALQQGLPKHQALRSAKNPVVRNLGGFTLGGPIRKEQTFFFGSYDVDLLRSTIGSAARNAITREGLDLIRANAAAQGFRPEAVDFLASTFPVANDFSTRFNVNVAAPGQPPLLIPFARFNRGLVETLTYRTNFHRFLTRLDHRLGERDQLFGRYLFDDSDDPGTPASLRGQEIGTAVRNQSLTLVHTHVFSPRAVNEFRFAYNRRAITFPLGETVRRFGAFSIGGVGGAFTLGNINFPQFRTDNIYQYANKYTFTFGRHSLRAGVDIRRVQLNSFFAPIVDGQVTYPNLRAFLRDENATFNQYAGEAYVPSRLTELGAFFQDDLRLTPNLTLNLGVRYEYTGTPFNYFSNAKPDINNWGPRFGFAWNPKTDRTGFWGWLTGGDKLVIRGGYSLTYDQIFQNVLLNTSRNYPRGVQVALGPISGQRLFLRSNWPSPPTPQDFVRLGGNPDLLPYRYFSLNKRVSQPYTNQYSLTLQRQFFNDYVLSIGYVGTRALKLIREYETNIGFFKAAVDRNPSVYQSVLPFLQLTTRGGQPVYLRDPARGSILVGDGHAQSWYNSLQVSLDKRLSRGLQFGAAYTYSSYISTSDDILGAWLAQTLPANPIDARLDRGRSIYDRPHRFVINYVWDIPGYKGERGVLRQMLSGWRLSGITTFQSGTPYSVFNNNNALGILPGQITTIAFSQRVSINPGGDPTLVTGVGPDGRPLNPNAYWIVPGTNSGIVGNSGRNRFRTEGVNNFDMALVKEIRITETQHLQVRWEVFNAFNHRQFIYPPPNFLSETTLLGPTQPDLNLGWSHLGLTGATPGGRSMIFTLRYNF